VNQRYYLENVGFALEAGEFYHDEAGGILYYWPTDGLRPSDMAVFAPVTDQAMEITEARDVVISNMSFVDLTYYADGCVSPALGRESGFTVP